MTAGFYQLEVITSLIVNENITFKLYNCSRLCAITCQKVTLKCLCKVMHLSSPDASQQVNTSCSLMLLLFFLCWSQAQTAPSLSPPLRPSGCSPASNRRPSLQVGRPIRLWCTLAWCGWWEVTPSITPTTTWSSSRLRKNGCHVLSCIRTLGVGLTLLDSLLLK